MCTFPDPEQYYSLTKRATMSECYHRMGTCHSLSCPIVSDSDPKIHIFWGCLFFTFPTLIFGGHWWSYIRKKYAAADAATLLWATVYLGLGKTGWIVWGKIKSIRFSILLATASVFLGKELQQHHIVLHEHLILLHMQLQLHMMILLQSHMQ